MCDESLLADVCPHLCIVTPGQQWEDVVSPSFGSFFNSHICSVSVLRLLYTVPSAFAVTPRNVCAGYMNRLVPTNCMSDTVLYGYGLSELQQSEKKCVLFLCNFKRLDLTRFYLVVFNCSNIFFKYKLWMFWFFFFFLLLPWCLWKETAKSYDGILTASVLVTVYYQYINSGQVTLIFTKFTKLNRP